MHAKNLFLGPMESQFLRYKCYQSNGPISLFMQIVMSLVWVFDILCRNVSVINLSLLIAIVIHGRYIERERMLCIL